MQFRSGLRHFCCLKAGFHSGKLILLWIGSYRKISFVREFSGRTNGPIRPNPEENFPEWKIAFTMLFTALAICEQAYPRPFWCLDLEV